MEARAIQRTVRQSPRKMRLVIDQIRGRSVPEAYALLKFSKKRAAVQIHKVLKSAVANAEQRARGENAALDVDRLRVAYAVVNEGQALKRWTSAAQGRATPIRKRTSHVEIHVSDGGGVAAPRPQPTRTAPVAAAAPVKAKRKPAKAAAGAKAKAKRASQPRAKKKRSE